MALRDGIELARERMPFALDAGISCARNPGVAAAR
jgi:hypothetical protein